MFYCCLIVVRVMLFDSTGSLVLGVLSLQSDRILARFAQIDEIRDGELVGQLSAAAIGANEPLPLAMTRVSPFFPLKLSVPFRIACPLGVKGADFPLRSVTTKV